MSIGRRWQVGRWPRWAWCAAKMDVVAIRLPSVLAILLTTLITYLYARTFLTPTGALAAGAAYASLLQVLQIGRLGENEALYALLVSGRHAGLACHLFARRFTSGGVVDRL